MVHDFFSYPSQPSDKDTGNSAKNGGETVLVKASQQRRVTVRL